MNTDLTTLARRATRQMHGTYARATQHQRTLPNFLIVGGQRCGTTTLYKTLSQHPGVLSANLRKGVHYFDLHYDRQLSWYRSHFPTNRKVSSVDAANGYPTAVGESSPYYLWHPLAPKRISNDLPGVKLLVLLRDPVERAYSAHAHERARGFETESFEQALELEPSRLGGQEQRLVDGVTSRSFAHQHQAYRARGEYIDQLERLAAAVGRQQVLVIDSQDFWSSPEQVWPQITHFLELPELPVVFERHNARQRAPMSETVRQSLTAHFEPFDERLATWWGRTPSWRR
ncbi:MAG TPA: sulfotransferase domain-containing protein [Actinomycetes bacterium]|nr:sulfotransferase domain-containing protein [Actinomycetes bacterium]